MKLSDFHHIYIRTLSKSHFFKKPVISICSKTFLILCVDEKCKNYTFPKSLKNKKRTIKHRIKVINLKLN